MRKILITSIILLNTLWSQISLSIGQVDYNAGTMEILMNSYDDVAGFQFSIEGAVLTDAAGGLAENYYLSLLTNSSTIFGYSTSSVIPAGEGILTVLSFSDTTGTIQIVTDGVDPEPLTGPCGTGDMNEDDYDNILDVVLIMNCILSPNTCYSCAGDVQEDGILNLIDVIGLLTYMYQSDNLSLTFSDPIGNPIPVFITDPYQEIIHVSIAGSDVTGDGTAENPFATIQTGIDSSETGDIVLVLPGTYNENINYLGKNIVISSTGGKDSTFIDGNQNGSVVTIDSGEDSTAVLNDFTIQNGLAEAGGGVYCDQSGPTLSNLLITNNSANGGGGGIYCGWLSNLLIHNVTIRNNSAMDGGGFYCDFSNPKIENSIIEDNVAMYSGGGFYFTYATGPNLKNILINNNSANGGGGVFSYNSNLTMLNVTIVNNTASGFSGGIYSFLFTNLYLTNCIVWDNYPLVNHVSIASVFLNYSDIQGGESGFYTDMNDSIYWGDGNLDADPLFCDSNNGNFMLAENSPCIGTGENGSNMGTFGVGCDAIFLTPDLVINEFLANSENCCDDGTGEFEDFIEIYNWGTDTVDIGGMVISDMFITDDFSIPEIWMIPDTVPEITTILPDSFLVLWADKNSEQGPLHVEIELSSDGVQIGLYMNDGITAVDTLTFGEQTADVSYGQYLDGSGYWQFMNPTPGYTNTEDLDVEIENPLPSNFKLHQPYPNPFNPTTTIRFSVAPNSKTSLQLFDITGRLVETLVSGKLVSGEHEIVWNAGNNPSGVYFVRLESGEFVKNQKVVLLK